MALPQRLKDAAKAIRKELKHYGIKHRLYSFERLNFNEVIDIYLEEVLLPATMKEIKRFTGRYDHRAKINIIPATISTEFKNELCQYIEERYGTLFPGGYRVDQMAWRIIEGVEKCDFWQSRKPRYISNDYFSASCYR